MKAKSSQPDRRLAPRPLPVHLASAMTLWLSSRAGLTSLKPGSSLWNSADDRLRALARELAPPEIDKVSAALDRVVVQRAGAGIRIALRSHGSEFEIGRHLTAEDRRGLAQELNRLGLRPA